jgi:Tol biopolymer transport system component
LPPSTFIFQRKVAADQDHIVAMDYVTGQQRVISTLAEPDAAGWAVDGMAVSPDRSRIVFASLYGPTQQDSLTGKATNRLWSMNTDGGDMLRLTPVFTGGPDTTKIDVRNPSFSPDGQNVYYEYGEYTGSWYVAPWWVAADGSAVPSLLQTEPNCTINSNPTFNPVTGDLLLQHTVCLGGVHGGFFLYAKGGGEPVHLVDDQGLDLDFPVFTADGSGLLFVARTSDQIQSLYMYVFDTQQIVTVVAGTADVGVVNAALSSDLQHLVYCLKQGDSTDLWMLDGTVDPPSTVRLTDDGASCDPVF